MVIHLNEFCDENEIVEGGCACPLNVSRNISTKITVTFYHHSNHLIKTTKRTVRVIIN